MRTSTLLGLLAAVAAAPAAQAFDFGMPSTFRGFRVEGNVGGDRFQSQAIHTDKFGYGGTAGFDGVFADRIVVGAEASYWTANKGSENNSAGLNGGLVHDKSFEEFGGAIRAGYLITPKLLIFGKGGYVNSEQRKSFNPTTNLFYVNGNIVGPERGYYNHIHTDGFQGGGGVEYSLTDMFYVNAQYVYSGYADHTARQRIMAGAGVRFK
ncbi:outer membrane protein [Sphingomonas nostoxanthinifaciens]|uniref:outer membrane protein n=1 Tax=Sphingomonas nostoxanthinifaciens TaxID=2872652 RepID=UPI001CC1C2A5|nr:outer membrane beta-barrel protein [Sphingomonas nostoxanthinifaciens]UAK23161.1 porin family protein [Sphingomonas nostoxanthinifaciens]